MIMGQTRKQYSIQSAHAELFRSLVAELRSWEHRAWSVEVRARSRSVFVIRATVVGHAALTEAAARIASGSANPPDLLA